MTGPLTGFTVLDLTRVLSGPYCTMVLGDLGARIVKVEHPGKGDDTRHWGPPFVGAESAYFLSINRNKESVTLDFKPAEGREILERLIAKADVFVENFRPGTLDRAGFGWEAMRDRFPRLVYASISGYGQTGPRSNEAGYDAVMQAEGGLMSVTGDADRPGYRLGVAITDMVSGLYCAQGITAALLARERSGLGQRVDIGMLDTTAALLTYQAANWFTTGETPKRKGNRHATIAPYETFTTMDGEIVIAVGNDEAWKRFCPAIGLPELAGDPRFTTNKDRMEHYDAMAADRPRVPRRDLRGLDRAAQCRRRRQRRSPRHRPDAERSAAGRARDGTDADASHRRRDARHRRADQTIGESGERPHAADNSRTTHRFSVEGDWLHRGRD